MANEFVRSDKDITDISKHSKKFLDQNDLVSTDDTIYIKNGEKFVKISEAVTSSSVSANTITFLSNNDSGTTTVTSLSVYRHLAYATSADGKTGFTTTKPETALPYIGTLVDFVSTSSTEPTKYQWTANSDYLLDEVNKLKAVKPVLSVNTIKPDDSGNVTLPTT